MDSLSGTLKGENLVKETLKELRKTLGKSPSRFYMFMWPLVPLTAVICILCAILRIVAIMSDRTMAQFYQDSLACYICAVVSGILLLFALMLGRDYELEEFLLHHYLQKKSRKKARRAERRARRNLGANVEDCETIDVDDTESMRSEERLDKEIEEETDDELEDEPLWEPHQCWSFFAILLALSIYLGAWYETGRELEFNYHVMFTYTLVDENGSWVASGESVDCLTFTHPVSKSTYRDDVGVMARQIAYKLNSDFRNNSEVTFDASKTVVTVRNFTLLE